MKIVEKTKIFSYVWYNTNSIKVEISMITKKENTAYQIQIISIELEG